QATISLLNLGARKLAPAGEGAPEGAGGQDLEQVRDAIDSTRALLEILERRIPQELPPLRDALSRLPMAYAQEVHRAPSAAGAPGAAPGEDPDAGGSSGSAGGEGSSGDSGDGSPPGGQGGASGEGTEPGGKPSPGAEQHQPGPAESSGRLWVPGK